jgi:hypothetical protein
MRNEKRATDRDEESSYGQDTVLRSMNKRDDGRLREEVFLCRARR